MRTFFTFFLLIIFIPLLSSQIITSDYQFQYKGLYSSGETEHEDKDGNIYISGTTSGVVNLD